MRSLLALVSTRRPARVDVLRRPRSPPPALRRGFGLSTSALGALSAVYALGGLVDAFPSGVLAVRVGVTGTVLTGLAIIVATSVAFGLAESVWVVRSRGVASVVGAALAFGAAAAVGTVLAA